MDDVLWPKQHLAVLEIRLMMQQEIGVPTELAARRCSGRQAITSKQFSAYRYAGKRWKLAVKQGRSTPMQQRLERRIQRFMLI